MWHSAGGTRFTHVDPFEDTESLGRGYLPRWSERCFTHVDPFEDTERLRALMPLGEELGVSPTSIRSRILKGWRHISIMEHKELFHPRRSVRGY